MTIVVDHVHEGVPEEIHLYFTIAGFSGLRAFCLIVLIVLTDNLFHLAARYFDRLHLVIEKIYEEPVELRPFANLVTVLALLPIRMPFLDHMINSPPDIFLEHLSGNQQYLYQIFDDLVEQFVELLFIANAAHQFLNVCRVGIIGIHSAVNFLEDFSQLTHSRT